jgi:2-phospho-L-lactate guanylyltransferase
VQWRVLIPIKHAAPAKTRLRGATREPAQHSELVRAIQLDTLDAVLALAAQPLFGGLFVVSDPAGAELPAGVEVLADRGGGLNAALSTAAAELAWRYPGDGVLAMVADLPALRSADLLAVLQRAPVAGRSFVRDGDGSGTTLLAAGPGSPLEPRFGIDSAARHLASGARELAAAAGVRRDVDSVEDLRRCLELGVGVRTSQLTGNLV